MRPTPWLLAEPHRLLNGPPAESRYGDSFGAFMIPYRGILLACIVSDGNYKAAGLSSEYAWEHVSVSLRRRTPNWYELDFVKDVFWQDDETVMQLHVPKANHINNHPHVLHLWRPIGIEIPLPPAGAI